MTELNVDPDGLTAVAEVARRQHEHGGRVSSYISSECSRFGAFSGVLNLFEGSYRSAVESALGGMRDGQTIATKVQTTVTACRTDYLESDREAYDAARKLFGTLDGFPPYDPPGSGQSSPGGPLSAPPSGKEGEEGDPFSLPGIPGDKTVDRVLPNDDSDKLPGVLNPVDAAKEAALERIRQEQMEQRYLDYREQGLTPDEARDAAKRDIDAGQQAQERIDAATRERSEGAYDDAHDQAIADGRSESEAREAGRDAAQDRHHTDSEDTRRRNESADTAGTIHDGYNGVKDAIDGVHDLVDNVQQFDETTDDLDDYDDYEGAGTDRSAQGWANR